MLKFIPHCFIGDGSGGQGVESAAYCNQMFSSKASYVNKTGIDRFHDSSKTILGYGLKTAKVC